MRMEWIVAAVLVAVALFVIAVFNRLIRQRNLVREGWSGIDVQLRRRTDLVPNLVETVKGYATHERGLFEDVTTKRALSIAADNDSVGYKPRRWRAGGPWIRLKGSAAISMLPRRIGWKP